MQLSANEKISKLKEEVLLRKDLSLVPKLSNHPSGCRFLFYIANKGKNISMFKTTKTLVIIKYAKYLILN